MAVDHDLKRARVVTVRNIAGSGSCHRCMNCGYSPGQAYGPEFNPTCYNCKYALYRDNAEGGITEVEALNMQVWSLKNDLNFETNLARALAIRALTGDMPEGYSPTWPETAAAWERDRVKSLPAWTQDWKAFIW